MKSTSQKNVVSYLTIAHVVYISHKDCSWGDTFQLGGLSSKSNCLRQLVFHFQKLTFSSLNNIFLKGMPIWGSKQTTSERAAAQQRKLLWLCFVKNSTSMVCWMHTQGIYTYEVGNFVGYTIQFLNLRTVSASLGVWVFKSTCSGPCTVPKFIPRSPFRCLQN